MKQYRMEKFKKMCKNCIFDHCTFSCDECHCNGFLKTEKTPYCKCIAVPSDKEKRCYYYRRKRY